MRRVTIVAIMSLALTQSMFAYRREYSVTLNGHRKPKSEVCIYRGIRTDAFSIFFSDPDVTCLPADQVLDFPPGLFNAFARHSDGYVSEYRDFTVFSEPPRPEQGYEMLEIPLATAGYIDFSEQLKSLPQGDSLGVWLSPTPKTVSTYFPLVRGETEVLVPVNTVVIPLHLRGKTPIAVGDAVSPEATEHVKARFHPNDHTVIAWVDFDKKAGSGADGILLAPDVLLRASGRTMKPIVPLFDPDATGTLLFFRGVPQGTVEIFVKGSMKHVRTKWDNMSRPCPQIH